MAPKRTGKATSSKVVVSPPKKEKPDESLLEKAEGEKKRARPLRKRSSDETIDRAIDSHFGHLTPYQKSTMQVDGMLIRERVTRDRHDLGKRRKRMGPSYWIALSAEYLAPEDPINALPNASADDVLSDQLINGLASLHNKNPAVRSVEPLITYLRHTESISAAELNGLCKAVVAPTLVNKTLHDNLLVEMIRALVRLGMHTTHIPTVEAMRSYFDAALTAQYSRLKSSGVTLQVWMACHEKEAALILDMADAKVVLAEKDSWHEVKSQVARLSALAFGENVL
jgi:hypothetical protein